MLDWCFLLSTCPAPVPPFHPPWKPGPGLASRGSSRATAAQRHRAVGSARATAAGPTALLSQASPVVSNPIRMARRSLLTSACSQAPLAQLAEQRTLNPRVRGSSPWRRTRTDLGFYKNQVIFSCPFCPHVCSMFARAHGPSNPGLVKNGPSGAGCGGIRPGSAPPHPADAAPPPLDQWSRPSSRTPGAHPESPTPMPSRSARPAGHRYSCDDQPLMPQARHTGYLPGMRRGSGVAFPRGGVTDASPLGAASPLGTPSADSARNVVALARHALAARACRLVSSRCTLFRQRLQGSAETAAARGGYCPCPASRGGVGHSRAGCPGPAGIPALGTVAPARGLCGPGTAYGRVGRERVAGISTGTPRYAGYALRLQRGYSSPRRFALPRRAPSVGDLVLFLAGHLRLGAVPLSPRG